ncbi:unnamed protein product [Schistosoma margrebowiei]|uniref:Uncharacterized protein n=1 Tax=Schistosoma margrebowiei TaxID=48269 RepID=A0A183MS16_9TREM|nr:unnamed protein product [Schistosoma margrebowiei]
MYADIFSSSDSDREEEPVRRIESRPLHLSSDEEDIKRIVKSGRNKRYVNTLVVFNVNQFIDVKKCKV